MPLEAAWERAPGDAQQLESSALRASNQDLLHDSAAWSLPCEHLWLSVYTPTGLVYTLTLLIVDFTADPLSIYAELYENLVGLIDHGRVSTKITRRPRVYRGLP